MIPLALPFSTIILSMEAFVFIATPNYLARFSRANIT